MLTKRELLLSAGSLAAVDAAGMSSALAAPGVVEAAKIAEAGFIYGFPIVMNYGVLYDFVIDRNSGQYKGPFNQIVNEARVFTYKDTSVVTPNSDTPYSMLWLDLGAEPMIISVPAVDPKRYYSVQLVDGNTYNYGYIGSRATGSDAGDYMVVGPNWQGATPPGIKKVFRATTRYGLTIFRTQLFDPKDMDNVKKVQAGYKAQPLSSYLKQPAPAALPVVNFPTINKQLAKRNFFEYLDFALQFAPATPHEAEIRAQLAKIGVGAGKSFNFRDLSLKDKIEIGIGMKLGQRKLEQKVKSVGKNINGWQVGSVFGDADFFNGDWLLRAAAAQMGIYGNNAEEAMYPATRSDVDGNPLDGKNNYTLTFPAGQLPPVNAFWSVTMYDGKTQFLIKNPIDRYLINSPMLANMKKNADGSLTIYIQNKSPGPDREANWLPAPAGPIYMAMRLYWPKTENPSILPPGKGTWQPPGVRKA
ncbi:MAG: DUF1254 domain-containing protein [Beijerinckiaceae bacterium]